LVTLWVFLGQVISADHSCRTPPARRAIPVCRRLHRPRPIRWMSWPHSSSIWGRFWAKCVASRRICGGVATASRKATHLPPGCLSNRQQEDEL
jgi:hypothetical protein